jgi:hypothetical protein
MKAIVITLSIVASVVVIVSCTKNDYKQNGGGQTCRCSGGISGSGFVTDLGNLSLSDAEKKCATYNQPGVADGYHDCHLE